MDEGKTLVSPKIIRNFKKGEPTDYQRKGQVIEFAVPVRSADVPQIQGAMLMTISCSEITATMMELNYQGLLLIAVIVVFVCFPWIYSCHCSGEASCPCNQVY